MVPGETINNHDSNYGTSVDVLSSTLSQALSWALYVHDLIQGAEALQGRNDRFHLYR